MNTSNRIKSQFASSSGFPDASSPLNESSVSFEHLRANDLLSLQSAGVHPNQLSSFYPCPVCGEVLTTRVLFQRHVSALHPDQLPFSCPSCGRGYFTKSGLDTHIKSDHAEKKFICHICDLRFKLKHHLQSHLRHRHKRSPCSGCEETFGSQAELDKHLANCVNVNVKLPPGTSKRMMLEENMSSPLGLDAILAD